MFQMIKNDLLVDIKGKNYKLKTLLQIVVISALSILVYLNIFQNDFVSDDLVFFFKWPEVKNYQVKELLEGSYPQGQHKVYRPVKSLIFATEYKIFNLNTNFYHLQAILINILATILVYLTISKLTGRSSVGFVSALLFGLHPAHTEAITYMTASLDSLGVIFFFISFYLYLISNERKKFEIASIVFAGLAFFTYELTLSLPIVIILYDLLFKKINRKIIKKKVLIYLGFFSLLIIFLLFRLEFVKTLQEGGFFAGSIYLTFLTMTKATIKYFELFIFPLNLSTNPILPGGIQSFVNIASHLDRIRQQSLFDLSEILSILLIIASLGVAFIHRRKRPIVTFSIIFVFLTLLPVLNIIPQELVMAERYTYISSFGAALLLGYIFNLLYNAKNNDFYKNILILALIFYVSFFSIRTFVRNFDWKDQFAYSKALASQNAPNFITDFYKGLLYFQQRQDVKASYYFKKVIVEKGDIELSTYFLTAIDLAKAIDEGNKIKAEAIYKKLYKMAHPEDRQSLGGVKRIIDKMPSK